jgi:DNA polymerase V
VNDDNPFDELANSDVLSIDAALNIHDFATYLVRLSGDSMQGAGMYEGDLMIVSKGIEPVRGHIVIAVVNGDVMVKRLDHNGYHPVLRSANPNYPPRHVMEGDEFSVWGVVTHTVHAH